MRLKIRANSRGIPSFLNDSTTSCIGLIDDKITMDVSATMSLDMRSIAQSNPVSVICIPKAPDQITIPGWINGWNAIIIPPKGNRSKILVREVLNEILDMYISISRYISKNIKTRICVENTEYTIMNINRTNLTLPSMACKGLFLLVSVSSCRIEFTPFIKCTPFWIVLYFLDSLRCNFIIITNLEDLTE
jgi:hypothetical protein